MFRSRSRAAVALALGTICLALSTHRTTAQQPNPDDKPKFDRVACWLNEIDQTKKTLKVRLDQGNNEATLEFNDKMKASFGGQPIKLDELKAGMRAELLFPANAPPGTAPVEVVASWPKQMQALTAVDPTKNTVSFKLTGDGGIEFNVSVDVAKDAKCLLDGLPAGLADMPVGRKLALDVSLDKKTIIGIESEADPADIPALAKSYDATGQTVLVEFDAGYRMNPQWHLLRPITLSLPVTAETKVRFKGADAKLTDLKEGMQLRLKMSADRKTVVSIFAAPPVEKPK